MGWDEPLAVTLALAYVVFAIKEKRTAWILAAASAALYLRIFFMVGLFMEASLQLFYIVMAGVGWISWGRVAALPSFPYNAGRLADTFYSWQWYSSLGPVWDCS